MLQRCTEIEGFSDLTDNGIADFLLARQNLILSELLKKLTNVHSITLKLQKEDLSMADIRLPFEAVALRYPLSLTPMRRLFIQKPSNHVLLNQ